MWSACSSASTTTARSAKGETGAVAALPIFIEFMQEAIKGTPPLDFKAPPNTTFAQIGPNREAFRPGTEPHAVQQADDADSDTGSAATVLPDSPSPGSAAEPSGAHP